MPASRLRSAKVPKRAPDLLPQAIDTQLLAAAESERDMLALIVLLDLGLRKSEPGSIRVRDFDLARRVLTVFGKGRKRSDDPI
jgi:integrase